MSGPIDPGRVLRRAIVGWGLGHAALGQRELGAGLLAGELLGLALVGAAVATLVDTTWYLVPFVMGSAFLVAWTAQAVHAYRAAQRRAGAIPPTPRGSAAAVAAWLAVPLLLWGTAFWLVAATAATPGAVLDRFVTAWPEGSGRAVALAAVTDQPDRLAGLADAVLDDLRRRCAAGELTSDCGDASANLLRGVRVRVEQGATDDHATAVAELVRYERRPVRFLGLAAGSELVPLPEAQLLRFDLEARPAPLPGGLELGARRWSIVNATRP
jgi:hypothetical protein